MDASTLQFLKELDTTTVPHLSLEATRTMARVTDVYDGDTLTLAMQVFGKVYKVSGRLIGVDTCERHDEDEAKRARAERARDRLLELIGADATKCSSRAKAQEFFKNVPVLVYVECGKFDKYGRVLVSLKRKQEDARTISEVLLEEGHAVKFMC